MASKYWRFQTVPTESRDDLAESRDDLAESRDDLDDARPENVAELKSQASRMTSERSADLDRVAERLAVTAT